MTYTFKQDEKTGLLKGPIEDLSEFQGNYGYLRSYDSLNQYLDKLARDGEPVSFDIETGYTGIDAEKRSLDPFHPDQMIVGFSLTNNSTMARYVPLQHDMEENLDPNKVWPIMKDFFESGQTDFIAHNCQFELRNLRAIDIKGDGPNIYPVRVHDTILQSYVIGQSQSHGLKALSKHWFNYDQRELDDLVASYAPKDKNGKPKLTAKQKAALRFNKLPLDNDVMNYVCDDVTWAWRLDNLFRPNIDVFGPELGKIYQMELEIMQLLVEMGEFGISVDWAGIRKGQEDYNVIIVNMEQEARQQLADLVNDEFAVAFNFASPKQVANLLFTELGLHPNAYTDTGAPSTSEGTLESLRRQHPIVDMILKLRQAKKMGQWFEQWNGYHTSFDEKIHPSLNQIRVQSGRFASDNPNVQNITKKWWYTSVPRDWSRFPPGDEGDKGFEKYVRLVGKEDQTYWAGNARDFLVASPGYRLLSFDYSAQEMRVLAGLTEDPYLLESFANGVDVHKTAASLMFHVPVDEVTDVQRQRGKGINFGLVYGRGPKALADDFGISLEESKHLISLYFSAFTKVGSWIEKQQRDGKTHHKIVSFYGRQSTLWDLFSDNEAIKAKADRMCINLPVQGGGADISKLAMIRSRKALIEHGWWGDKVRMLMNQHDSLVFEVHQDMNINEVVEVLQPMVMLTGVPELEGFPAMVVDWEVGHRWGSLEPYTPDLAMLEDQEVAHQDQQPVQDQQPEQDQLVTGTVTQTVSPGGTMKVMHSSEDFSVELSGDDGQKQFPDWDDLSVLQQFAKLASLAELLGATYQVTHGKMDPPVYAQVSEKLKARLWPQPQEQAA